MSIVYADRKAVRRSTEIDPGEERRRIAHLYASIPRDNLQAAAEIALTFPRLIHQLARRGALKAPGFPAR